MKESNEDLIATACVTKYLLFRTLTCVPEKTEDSAAADDF